MTVINKKGKMIRVPDATIMRLPLYLDKLMLLQQAGVKEVSSRQLATSLDIKASQLRHDFHYFGGFSKPGRPYQVDLLVPALEEIIGISEPVPLIIVGAGHLGQALANYGNFERQGFPTRGIFDVDSKLVGTEIRGIPIRPLSEVEQFVRDEGIRLAVLTLPVHAAQEVADRLVAAGIQGFWNFTPTDIKAPKPVVIRNERLAVGLMCLSFKTKRRDGCIVGDED
ncbi:MAG TPA: redox-sensing transcriptional repressor Rex [Candidatus Krumholzibacteria bacterium]|nr:redox-sensing transcriptional repressor Rex [Candidatus Krumholzibacteria bacterium]HRX50502.1 redox-sensing transcriptional repressor Rex [Candidatus Krumholzibacteria bacterium]